MTDSNDSDALNGLTDKQSEVVDLLARNPDAAPSDIAMMADTYPSYAARIADVHQDRIIDHGRSLGFDVSQEDFQREKLSERGCDED